MKHPPDRFSNKVEAAQTTKSTISYIISLNTSRVLNSDGKSETKYFDLDTLKVAKWSRTAACESGNQFVDMHLKDPKFP